MQVRELLAFFRLMHVHVSLILMAKLPSALLRNEFSLQRGNMWAFL